MHRTVSKVAIFAMAFVTLVGITALMIGQPSSKTGLRPAAQHRLGVADDWSHHHLVFSNPGTYERTSKNAAAYSKWLTIRYDKRFILQQTKRHADATAVNPRELPAGGSESVLPVGNVNSVRPPIGDFLQMFGEGRGRPKPLPRPKPKPKSSPLKGDWSVPMSTGTVQPNAYPAKWGQSLTASSCFFDFLAYPTGVAGSPSSASIVAFNNLYNPSCNETGAVPATYWAFDTGGTISTSPTVTMDESTQLAFVQVSGSSASLVIMKPYFVVQATVTDGLFDITITSGTITSADVGKAVFGGGMDIGTTIKAVNGSTVTLSKLVQDTYTADNLVIVQPGTLGAPFSLTSQASGDAYHTCTAPCMLALPLSGGDTFSAPFYDYNDDVMYVGDDSGNLHMFTHVFNGSPSEVTSSWPVNLGSNSLTSPVYDPVSGNVFVGDLGGVLYSVGTGIAGGTTSGALDGVSSKLGDAIVDGPLVDSTAGMVYAFVTTSNGNNTVYQFPTSFTSGAGASVAVGTGGTGLYLYDGDFDNVYYQSSTQSGDLFVVGNTGGSTGATLYRIPLVSNVMQTPIAAVTGLSDAGEPPWPSPLIEFCNNGKSSCGSGNGVTNDGRDYVFFSVNRGAVGSCTNAGGNGCVLSYEITAPSSPTFTADLNVTSMASPGCWATSGIVIDNSYGAVYGDSQIYFVGLNGNTAGGATGPTSTACASGSGNISQAVQASQTGVIISPP